MTCNGHGTCNYDGECQCTGNFTGPHCDLCIPDFYTPACDICMLFLLYFVVLVINHGADCTNDTCNNHGTCHNETGQCECTGHFTGPACISCISNYYNETCDVCMLFFITLVFLYFLTFFRLRGSHYMQRKGNM